MDVTNYEIADMLNACLAEGFLPNIVLRKYACETYDLVYINTYSLGCALIEREYKDLGDKLQSNIRGKKCVPFGWFIPKDLYDGASSDLQTFGYMILAWQTRIMEQLDDMKLLNSISC